MQFSSKKKVKNLVCLRAQWPIRPVLIILVSVTNNISNPTPLDGKLVITGLPTGVKFASTHLYTRMERGSHRVGSLVQEYNRITPASISTRTAEARAQRTNHKSTAPMLLY